MIVKIYGPPGTGKTTTLWKLMQKYQEKIPLKQMMFISFSNAAIESIFSKMGIKYDKNTQRKYPYFRTLHGLCLSFLMSNYKSVYNKIRKMFGIPGFIDEAYVRFCRKYHIPIEEDITSELPGNRAISMWGKIVNLYYPKLDIDGCLDILKKEDEELYHIIELWYKHKKERGYLDWIDIEILCYNKGLSFVNKKNPPKIAFIDEAQDFSPLEWKLIEQIIEGINTVYLCGDDMQAIYSFKGARADEFLYFPCDTEKILKKTYRLPSNVVKYSNEIMKLVSKKKWKNIIPAREGGKVVVLNKPVSIQQLIDIAYDYYTLHPNETIYILLRTNSLVKRAREYALMKGIYYKELKNNEYWNKKVPIVCNMFYKLRLNRTLSSNELELFFNLFKPRGVSKKIIKKYIKSKKNRIIFSKVIKKMGEDRLRTLFAQHPKFKKLLFKQIKVDGREIQILDLLLRKMDKLFKNYNIYIDTMHASKGLEADLVIIADGLTKHCVNSIKKEGREAIDNELRTYYVAVTRAKKSVIIAPIEEGEPFITKYVRW